MQTVATNPTHQTVPSTMQAWTLDRFGRHNLKLDKVPVPAPGPNEVLVRVRAVSLNYRDKLVIEGDLLPRLPAMPFVPVSDMAGDVVAVGSQVTRLREGDVVASHFRTAWVDGPPTEASSSPDTTLGGPLQGAAAEYIALPAAASVPVPEYLSHEEAATLPIAGLTAWMALGATATPKRQETVLVEGTGGVSLFAFQLAQALGHRVLLISRSEEKLRRAGDIGAQDTLNTSNHPNWVEHVLRMTGGKGVDRVIEVIGGPNVSRSLEALAVGGVIKLVGFLAGMELTVSYQQYLLC